MLTDTKKSNTFMDVQSNCTFKDLCTLAETFLEKSN